MEKIEPTVKTVEEEFAEAASGEQAMRLNVNAANNGVATRQSLKEMQRLIIAVFIPVIITGALLFYILIRSINTEPPLTYDSLTITSGNVVCPGDTLTMTVTGRVTRAPELVAVVHTLVERASGRNLTGDEHPEWRPLDRVRPFINPHQIYTVPYDIEGVPLPPGEYEFRISAQGFRGGMGVISVPFTVKEDCENGALSR